ncbi:hypothetical protein HYX00_02530 [Candidatus Woesearchaeota archaeon]|nr:hypothetical protein [Candidatus Woesearchaeota archaeon]
MADRRIVEYLKLGRKKGVPFDILKKKLLEKGHSAKRIEEAAKESGIRNYQYKPLVIVSIVILLILFFLIIQNVSKKRGAAGEQLTSEKQLSIINKALNEKYANYKIKNYGSVVYDGKEVLRAEVDLGFVEVCNQKIKADDAIIVVEDKKIIPTPLNEIKNKFSKNGKIVYDTTNGKDANPDINKVNRQISYDCTVDTCSNCQLNNVYEVLIKLNSTYTKNADSLLDFRSGIIRTSSANQGSGAPVMKLTGAPPLNEATGPNGQKMFRIQPGETKITHKLFLVDEIGNTIYSSEGSEKENNLIFLKGEFS